MQVSEFYFEKSFRKLLHFSLNDCKKPANGTQDKPAGRLYKMLSTAGQTVQEEDSIRQRQSESSF